MFKLIKGSFLQRRKTLVNGISNFSELNFTKEEVAEALTQMGLSESIRGEKLTLADFATLSNILNKKI